MDATEIRNKIKELDEEIFKLKKYLEVLEELCEHNFFFMGNLNNASFAVCAKCGKVNMKEEWGGSEDDISGESYNQERDETIVI